MINESTRPLYRGTQVVWYVLYVIEGFLALRFILRLLQANPEAAFTSLIYNISSFFTLPFVAVFGNLRVEGSVIEWTTLLAMFVYWLLAIAIVKLLVMSKPVSTFEAHQRLRE
ncbi:MAG TPA: YggT family protein [Candidatus Paceibacterota bacterium]|nr:YggT family protein [Candidatus Paceibacterota bacterium]HMO82901.1 YggT family protein [Candidatus Paceibacterota bacterium]